MSVLLYLPETKEAGARLYGEMKSVVPERSIERLASMDEMRQRLHEPMTDIKIAVLYLRTREELRAILPLSDFLWDVRLILVLPDEDPLTVSQAHLLRPRFITYVDSPFNDLGVVLRQMARLCPDCRHQTTPPTTNSRKPTRTVRNRLYEKRRKEG